MFNRTLKQQWRELSQTHEIQQAWLSALKTHVPCIELLPEGTVAEVNDPFLAITGHRSEQLVGQPYRLLCARDYAHSPSYDRLWKALRSGQSVNDTIEHINATGDRLWLHTLYFPVQQQGKVTRVVAIASDITSGWQRLNEHAAVAAALDCSQAIIEFTPDGTILTANPLFLQTVGYSLESLQGKHHKILCLEDFYQRHPDFWTTLARGEFKTGRFERRNAQGDISPLMPPLKPHGRGIRAGVFLWWPTKCDSWLYAPLSPLAK